MAGPSWLAGILAAVMIATAIYCVARLVIARATRRAAEPDVDLVHAVMAVAMAGMLTTRLNPLPNGVWAVLFGAATAWFGWRITRACHSRQAETGASGRAPGYYVPHLVMSGTMVYMLLAVAVVKPGSASHVVATGGGAHFPAFAFVLALFMFGYVMWQADRLPALAMAAAPGHAGVASGTVLARAVSQPAHAQAAAAAQSAPGAAAATDPAPGAASPRGRPLSPRLAACYQITMGITMGYMLIMMV